jgi:8-oxo-dGTP pyrophosphatase MutT (NUDIX family)
VFSVNDKVKDQVRRALSVHSTEFTESESGSPAAVLVPLFLKEQSPHLLLTKRSAELRNHRGEVAFPGGRRDHDDASPVETALRESKEEVGLHPDAVEVLGALDTFKTGTGFRVTPIVGVIPYPYSFTVNPHEIAQLIEVPLPVIARPEAREVRDMSFRGRSHAVHFFHYAERDPIWGASGYIVHRFLEVVYPLLSPGASHRERPSAQSPHRSE